MKFKSQIVTFILTFLLTFTVGFQGVHGGFHLVKQFSEKHCNHKYQKHKNEINHSHHQEDCADCEFTFSPFYNNLVRLDYKVVRPLIASNVFGIYKQIHFYFTGSLFALRAPPYLI